jgi:hypothetical protein
VNSLQVLERSRRSGSTGVNRSLLTRARRKSDNSRERRERGCGWVEMIWVADVGRKHPGITQVRARESANQESV